MLKVILIGGLDRISSPIRVETAATSAAHHPPNRRAAAICMTKLVEPLAASLNRVLKLSSMLATNTNVASGHHPGNGSRKDQTAAPAAAAQTATPSTKKRIRASRDIGEGGKSRSDFG